MKKSLYILVIILALITAFNINIYSGKSAFQCIKVAKFSDKEVQGLITICTRGEKLYIATDNFMCNPASGLFFVLAKNKNLKPNIYGHDEALPNNQFVLMNYTVKMSTGINPDNWNYIVLFNKDTKKILAIAKLENCGK